jgi:methionine synthase reductase
MKDIHVLYGSQFGNSEAIAKQFKDKLLSYTSNVFCQTLNSVANVDLKNSILIIICSTTGNGDSPDNASLFWRKIKNRSIDKNYFNDVLFSVLALGDTNYSNFCQIGKFIDKRISEIGGKRLLQLTCIDDAVDPENDILKWESNLMDILSIQI